MLLRAIVPVLFLREEQMTHLIHTGTTRGEIPIEFGTRVAAWHQSYAEQMDPVPATVQAVGEKFLTVLYDGQYETRRIEPRNVTYWSEPVEDHERRYEITYMPAHRPQRRVVGPEHFEQRGGPWMRVLNLTVGQVISNRYRSAGYRQIRRIA